MRATRDPHEALTAERDRAQEQVATLERDVARLVAASEGSNGDDEHDPEGATIAFERAQLTALLDAGRQRLADVETALARVTEGGYGRCERCGEPIDRQRLVARPAARECIHCAREQATARSGVRGD